MPCSHPLGELEGAGLNFLRFHDEEIRKDMDAVMRTIREYISSFVDMPEGEKENRNNQNML